MSTSSCGGIDRRALAASGALLVAIFVLAWVWVIPAEDAVILYEYSRRLATEGMITYGGANILIEGATDFLWMLVIAGLRTLGAPEFASALALNLVATGAMLVMAGRTRAVWLTLLALLVTPYLYSALQGFSTLAFAAVYVGCVALALERSRWLALSILVLCLIRPDGVIWGTGLLLLRASLLESRAEALAELRRLVLLLALPGIAYFAWRTWYFGELFPLPFYVKGGGARDLLLFHSGSLRFVLLALLPVAAAVLIARGRPRLARETVALFLLPALFYAAMRLEQNIGNRFLAPMFFGGLFLFLRSGPDWRALAFVALSAAAGARLTAGALLDAAESPNEVVYELSLDLSALDGRMLVTEAGRLAYYSGWLVHDAWGLNTPAYAREMISAADLEAEDYDLIVAHCPLTWLKADAEVPRPERRSWNAMCAELIRHVRGSDYDLWIVPFKRTGLKDRIKAALFGARPENTCARHDLYAISDGYPQAEALVAILARHGGAPWDEPMNVIWDRWCP